MTRKAKDTLTQKAVERVQATGKVQYHGDKATPGLQLWVGASGTKLWRLRSSGKSRVLGDATKVTLEQARRLATSEAPVAAPIVAPVRREKTIADYIALYVDARAEDWSESVVKRAPRLLSHFLAGILHRPLAAMDRSWIIARQKQMLKTTRRGTDRLIRGSTVVTYTKHLKAFANWLVAEEHLDKSPFHGRRIKPVRVNPPEVNAVDDRGKALIEAACDHYPRASTGCWVLISLYTGMRKGEIMALRWSDIDFRLREITVRGTTTKTGVPLVVPMANRLANFLMARRERCDQERLGPKVKPEHRDQPFHHNSDWHWHELLKTAELGHHLRFHDIRRSFATLAHQRGGSILDISAQLNHASVATTYRYLDVNKGRRKQLVALLEQDTRPYLPPPHLRGDAY